jgi:hypothetical protein
MLILMQHTDVAKRLSIKVRPPAVDAGHDSFGGRTSRLYILLSLLCCLSQKMRCHAMPISHYSSILSFHHSNPKVVRVKQSQEAVVGSRLED